MTELLLITTDDEMQMQIRDHFDQRGLPVRCERDAASAFRMLAVKAYPLIMLDTDGVERELPELLAAIRQQSKVPVFILSSRSSESEAITALDAGADDYITKPVRAGELVAKAAAVLRREAANGTLSDDESELLEGRDICLDTKHRRVWVHGRKSTLPGRNTSSCFF